VPPEPDDLARHFPQLEILELLGSGGMGAVYKARQRRLDRLVALKILPPEVARHPGFEERFTREARALGRLNDPHIVTLHDFGIAGGLYYFLMEFVDGVNLRQMIAGGELSPREALAIVPQVCDALQYAHDEGIVHRDIKPENILLDKKGRVKIADFGLAKLMRDSDDPAGRADLALTGSQQVMGTPHYMAPEQMKRPLGVDHRADIFSLGVVFYEMLTGELPLGRFAPPSRMVEIDVRLDEVVLRSLEKEPELRYQHASDVKSDVENISWDKPAPFNAKPGDKDDLDELGRRGEPSFFAKLADAREPDGLLELFRSLVKESWLQYLLISVACCLCAIVVVSAWRSWTHPTGPVPFAPMPYSESVPPVLESLPPHAMPLYSPFWELTPDGPRLTDEFVQNVLKLSPSQIAQTNKILKAHYEDGLEIESRHLERQTDALGHVIVSIRPYLGPTMQLEDLLWSELDLILDPKQQDLARLNLKLEPRKFTSAMPIPTSELAGPGFFGWGKDGAKIELWRVGSWFQWHVESRGTSDSGRARELPAYYRHFWDQSANDRRGAN
jgi:serine/threonine protein kinase